MATAEEKSLKELREVFDLCDVLKVGVINVTHLNETLRQHALFGGSEEDFKKLIECLDPNRQGVVTFSDFCQGVQVFRQSIKSSSDETKWRYPQATLVPGVEVNGDPDSAIATGSDISRESLADKHDSVSDEDSEEKYMCLEVRPDNSCFRNGGIPGVSRRRRSSRAPGGRSGSKRLSTSALASQLHRSSSRRNSQSSSDEMFANDVPLSIEDDVLDLNEKVQELQQQVATLSDNQMSADHKYNRVKQENAALHNRIHSLEEQLRELEIRSEDRIEAEQQKFKEIMTRCERESKIEVEMYANKLFSLQKEYMEISEESLRLKTLVEKLKLDKQELQNQLAECTNELLSLREDHRRLQEASHREREEFLTERSNSNKLLEELTKDLEKHSETQTDTRLRSPSLLELPAQYRELQQELRKVKDENKLILETNEELSAQLLSNSLQEGRTLVNQNSAFSLADEFESLTKDEMMKALHDQKEVNEKLKAYIDGILLNILENHPQLLEVKNPL